MERKIAERQRLYKLNDDTVSNLLRVYEILDRNNTSVLTVSVVELVLIVIVTSWIVSGTAPRSRTDRGRKCAT